MKAQQGFTLIELMIVVAIVAILAGIAVPEYNKYITKAEQAKYINVGQAYKTGIAVCYNIKQDFNECRTNEYAPETEEVDIVKSSTILADGIIEITMTTSAGGATYEVTPTATDKGTITWAGVTKCGTSNKDFCFGGDTFDHD